MNGGSQGGHSGLGAGRSRPKWGDGGTLRLCAGRCPASANVAFGNGESTCAIASGGVALEAATATTRLAPAAMTPARDQRIDSEESGERGAGQSIGPGQGTLPERKGAQEREQASWHKRNLVCADSRQQGNRGALLSIIVPIRLSLFSTPVLRASSAPGTVSEGSSEFANHCLDAVPVMATLRSLLNLLPFDIEEDLFKNIQLGAPWQPKAASASSSSTGADIDPLEFKNYIPVAERRAAEAVSYQSFVGFKGACDEPAYVIDKAGANRDDITPLEFEESKTRIDPLPGPQLEPRCAFRSCSHFL